MEFVRSVPAVHNGCGLGESFYDPRNECHFLTMETLEVGDSFSIVQVLVVQMARHRQVCPQAFSL